MFSLPSSSTGFNWKSLTLSLTSFIRLNVTLCNSYTKSSISPQSPQNGAFQVTLSRGSSLVLSKWLKLAFSDFSFACGSCSGGWLDIFRIGNCRKGWRSWSEEDKILRESGRREDIGFDGTSVGAVIGCFGDGLLHEDVRKKVEVSGSDIWKCARRFWDSAPCCMPIYYNMWLAPKLAILILYI